ncbi:carboxypeptidase C prc1 [Physocladia obscura]|uniref:Carboxypeptidase C prc1 n=1 Tax=Physocladia obscura TaxID=109957 RepID=A0AAD5XBL6_9FUNG|nr:carboxypeptidase C prc1 [Physocladia obscura]
MEIPRNTSAEAESDTDGEFAGSANSRVKLPVEQIGTTVINSGPTFARTPVALKPTTKSAHEPFLVTVPASVCRIASVSSGVATAGMRSDKEKEKEKEKENEGAEKRQQESLDCLLNNKNSTNASSSFSTSSRSLSHRFRSLSTPILSANAALQNALLPYSANPVPQSNLTPKRQNTSNILIGFSPRRLQNQASFSSLTVLNNKSLIATAKNLFEQLEFMWAELSNGSETPPASPSPISSPSALQQQKNQLNSKSDANSSNSETIIPEDGTSNTNNSKFNNANSAEVEEIDAGFFAEKKQRHLAFFKKPKTTNANTASKSISSNYSEAVQGIVSTDDSNDKKATSGASINFKILDALKTKDNSDKVVDKKALLPIIANLEKLVGDESNRRSAVVQNIKNLHDQLFSACERLCVPIDKFINPQNFPSNASIYTKRDILMSRVANVESVLKAREERLLGLMEAVAESRKALEEDGQTDNRFEMTVKDDLSVATVEVWVDQLYKLEEEKSLRQAAICKCCAKIYTTAIMLNKFPSETDQEKNLTEFLQTPDTLATSTTTTKQNDTLSQETTASPQQKRQSLKEQQQRLQEHYMDLLDRHNDQPGFSLSLTKSCIAWLETVLVRLENDLSHRREQCVRYVKEIRMCLDELGGEGNEKFELDSDDLERLDEYAKLANDLRARWRLKMQEVVVRLLLDMTTWWDKCCVTPEERKEFTLQFGDNLFSPLTVERISKELVILQQRYEDEKHIYILIEQRSQILARMVEFEISASDPRRLFRSSFQLNEEERFRKTCIPTLLKVEEMLRLAIRTFEEEQHHRQFIFRGTNYLPTLEKEISERFLNDALFIFDTTGLSQTRTRPLSSSTSSSSSVKTLRHAASQQQLRSPTVNAASAASAVSPKLVSRQPSLMSLRHSMSHQQLQNSTTAQNSGTQKILRQPSLRHTASHQNLRSPVTAVTAAVTTTPTNNAGTIGVSKFTRRMSVTSTPVQSKIPVTPKNRIFGSIGGLVRGRSVSNLKE